MKKAHIYKSHQAFDAVYKELIQGGKGFTDGFVAPKRYHHAPDKLKSFTDYRTYFLWSTELYASANKLTSLLRVILEHSNKLNSQWHSNKSKVKNILVDLNNLKPDLDNLYDDILEFQNCMLATDINQKDSQIEPLSDQMRYLTSLEDRITETCNSKLYAIDSTRLALAGVFIGLCALVIALVSLTRSANSTSFTPGSHKVITSWHFSSISF